MSSLKGMKSDGASSGSHKAGASGGPSPTRGAEGKDKGEKEKAHQEVLVALENTHKKLASLNLLMKTREKNSKEVQLAQDAYAAAMAKASVAQMNYKTMCRGEDTDFSFSDESGKMRMAGTPSHSPQPQTSTTPTHPVASDTTTSSTREHMSSLNLSEEKKTAIMGEEKGGVKNTKRAEDTGGNRRGSANTFDDHFVILLEKIENIPPHLKAFYRMDPSVRMYFSDENGYRRSNVVTWPARSSTTHPVWKMPRRLSIAKRKKNKSGDSGGLSKGYLHIHLMLPNAGKVGSAQVSLHFLTIGHLVGSALSPLVEPKVCTVWFRRVPMPKVKYKYLFLLRHAESEWNWAKANKSLTTLVSQVDHPLTAYGMNQSRKFRSTITSLLENTKFDNNGDIKCNENNKDAESSERQREVGGGEKKLKHKNGTSRASFVSNSSLSSDRFRQRINLSRQQSYTTSIPKKEGSRDYYGGHTNSPPLPSALPPPPPLFTRSISVGGQSLSDRNDKQQRQHLRPSPRAGGGDVDPVGENDDNNDNDTDGGDDYHDNDKDTSGGNDGSSVVIPKTEDGRSSTSSATPTLEFSSIDSSSNKNAMEMTTAAKTSSSSLKNPQLSKRNPSIQRQNLSATTTMMPKDSLNNTSKANMSSESRTRVRHIGTHSMISPSAAKFVAPPLEFLEKLLNAEAALCSPLTRAVQTCIISLGTHPMWAKDKARRITLLSCIREKRGWCSLDTQGRDGGTELVQRLVRLMGSKCEGKFGALKSGAIPRGRQQQQQGVGSNVSKKNTTTSSSSSSSIATTANTITTTSTNGNVGASTSTTVVSSSSSYAEESGKERQVITLSNKLEEKGDESRKEEEEEEEAADRTHQTPAAAPSITAANPRKRSPSPGSKMMSSTTTTAPTAAAGTAGDSSSSFKAASHTLLRKSSPPGRMNESSLDSNRTRSGFDNRDGGGSRRSSGLDEQEGEEEEEENFDDLVVVTNSSYGGGGGGGGGGGALPGSNNSSNISSSSSSSGGSGGANTRTGSSSSIQNHHHHSSSTEQQEGKRRASRRRRSDRGDWEAWLLNRIDVNDCTDKWWDTSKESSQALAMRMGEFVNIVHYRPETSLIVVGHSAFFRQFVQNYASSKLKRRKNNLVMSKLANCEMRGIKFSLERNEIVDVVAIAKA